MVYLFIYFFIGYLHYLFFNRKLRDYMLKSKDSKMFREKPLIFLFSRAFTLIVLWPLLFLKIAE